MLLPVPLPLRVEDLELKKPTRPVAPYPYEGKCEFDCVQEGYDKPSPDTGKRSWQDGVKNVTDSADARV
jgi:hypothetical protein